MCVRLGTKIKRKEEMVMVIGDGRWEIGAAPSPVTNGYWIMKIGYW
jgi:hypothetical protein